MNDFTKEELEEILTCVCVIPYSPNQSHLATKLKSMIVNYCEHDISFNNPMYKCHRCESKDINSLYRIKYGLHDWFLCNECSSQFTDWIRDTHADNGCGWAKEHFKRKYNETQTGEIYD